MAEPTLHSIALKMVDSLEGIVIPEILETIRDAIRTPARLAPARLRHCSIHGQQPANAWGCPECVREMRAQLAQAPPALAAKALEVLEALADLVASGEKVSITIAHDWGFGGATLIAPNGAHTHVGGDWGETREENLALFVDGLHEQLVLNAGLSWVATDDNK